MWRPNEPVEEDGSNLFGIDPQSKRRRSRRRAWRDGFADQTVVGALEDVRSYRAFERTLVGSVDPRSVLELVLVHRLASLLWRLRRACAIETGLFEIRGGLLIAHRQDLSRGPTQRGTLPSPTRGGTLPSATRANGHSKAPGSNGGGDPLASDQEALSSTRSPRAPWSDSRTIAQCFLRLLSNRDLTLLEHVGSYEAKLWHQAAQTIWTLEELRRPPPAPTRRPFRKPVVLSFWDAERSGMK
jgi:hypothetical protein